MLYWEFVASQFAKIKPSQVTQTVVVVDQQESDEDKDKDAVNSPARLKRRGRPLGSKKKKRI